MDVSLQRYILQNYPVNSHPNLCLPLKRLDMDITGITLNRPFYQTVKKVNNRRFLIVAQLGQINIFQFLRAKAGICLFCRLSGAGFRKIIGNGLTERFFFTQHNFQVASRLLAHFLKGKIIDWIVGYKLHNAALHLDRKKQVLFRQILADHGNRRQINLQRRHIYNLQLQPGRHRFQHLKLRDKSKLHQNLPDTHIPVLPLIGQRLSHLFLSYITELR